MGKPLYKPRPERWPQFSLRGLLVVLTLVAMLMPWAIDWYRAGSVFRITGKNMGYTPFKPKFVQKP